MNAERLIRMVVNMAMRYGMRRLSRGQNRDPNAQRAQQSMRWFNRIRRM